VSEVERNRRRTTAALSTAGQRCLCPDCAGSSVTAQLIPIPAALDRNAGLARTAEHIARLIRREAARHTGRDFRLDRHDGSETSPSRWGIREFWQRREGSLPENQWTAFARLAGRRSKRPEAATYATLTSSAGWWWLNEGIAVVSDRPLALHTNERGRLHRPDGPAVVYEDGFSVNAVDGVLLPDWYFEPGVITIDRIENEPNLEVRRLLIERFGADRYVTEIGGLLIHEDETGQLWSVMRQILGYSRTEMRMVRVVDATPQPDGNHRVYWLHVPNDIETARRAVAWTFSLNEAEYAPEVQT
jgi:hypothetical protein